MIKNPSDNKKQRGQGIIKVSDLFDKYKKVLRAPQKTVIHTFIEAANELFSITLKPDQCSYSPHTRIISVRAPGMMKTEIQLEKRHILNYMREKLGDKSAPKDIL